MTIPRHSLTRIIEEFDTRAKGDQSPDTVSTGFPSIDRALGGGLRRQDLVVLGGDVGSGKSALALAMGLRAASAGFHVVYLSGEMDRERLLERVLAIEGRTRIDDLRNAQLSDESRASIGVTALKFQELPLFVYPLLDSSFEDAFAEVWQHQPALVIVDYLQLISPPTSRLTQAEDLAVTLRALKALALDRRVAFLTVAQLPDHTPEREDPRPSLNDFGALGTVKQLGDVVLGLYREEMYSSDSGVEGATELLILKNRNGPTGFVDLYFYEHWMRFEDMLDK